MPGLIYGVETLLFLYIVLPKFTMCILESFRDKEGLGAIVSVFFASGVLGYIFAAVHHWVRFHWHSLEKDIFNHQPVIKELCSAGRIRLSEDDLRRLESSRETAESISLAHWYLLLTEKTKLGTDGIDHLRNQAHALGTARIASCFALVSAVLLSWRYGTPDCSLGSIACCSIMVLLGVVTILMFHNSYERVALFAQKAYDETLRKNIKQAS
jgi:hypothetical protein